MTRKHIIILIIVVLADLAFIWWHYGPRKTAHPSSGASPVLQFRTSTLPGPPVPATPPPSADDSPGQ